MNAAPIGSVNPILTGFNPDPSIVLVGDYYYLCTSSFEYFPGLPIYRSDNLSDWEQIGNVVTRAGQLRESAPTNLGAWAPTIRHRDGVFYVTVGEVAGRGVVVFSATDPAGPWDDGVELVQGGYDPDLAWDTDGTCYLTFTKMMFGDDTELEDGHGGLQLVPVDLASGRLLGEIKPIWQQRREFFPEGSHLYRIGDYWYLTVAEGGTDRGHMISLGRSSSIDGPYEEYPHNPVLSARSTMRKVQNTGHADLFQTKEGDWAMVLLGVRPLGLTSSFSPLGRETFITPVDWVDGWPVPRPVELGAQRVQEFRDDFDGAVLGSGWISPQRLPSEVGTIGGGHYAISGQSWRHLTETAPNLVAKRLQLTRGVVTTKLKLAQPGTTAGLVLRYNECANFAIELGAMSAEDAEAQDAAPRLSARFEGYLVKQRIDADTAPVPDAEGWYTLYLDIKPPQFEFSPKGLGSDLVELGWIDGAGTKHAVAEFDGRYLSQEFNGSFTGRVVGPYCEFGAVLVTGFAEVGVG